MFILHSLFVYLHMTTFCIRRVLDFETTTKQTGRLSAGFFGLSDPLPNMQLF